MKIRLKALKKSTQQELFVVKCVTPSAMYFTVEVQATSIGDAIKLAKAIRPGCERYFV